MKVSRNLNKKQEESVPSILGNLLGILSDFLICIYVLLVLVVMPFYFQDGYRHIGIDKSFFFCKVSIETGKLLLPVLVPFLAVRAAIFWKKRGDGIPGQERHTIKTGFSGTDWFAALYGMAQILSYVLSRYQETALWGAEGWYMGFWPQIFLVVSYFLISRLWKPRKWMFSMVTMASAAVFALGYLNRFSVYPIEMAKRSPSYISTIGNINWYCGYVVSVLFAAVTLLWMQGLPKQYLTDVKSLLLSGYAVLGFGTLLTQGSDSGMVTMIVMISVYFCFSVSDRERMEQFWYVVALFWGACMVTYIIQKMTPGKMDYVNSWTEILLSWPVLLLMAGLWGGCLCWLRCRQAKKVYPEKAFRIVAIAWVTISCLGMVMLLGLIAVNTLWSGKLGGLSSYPLFTFSEDWGSLRGATWKAGFMCFVEQDVLHKIVGAGPDSMWEAISRHGSMELRNMVQDKFNNLHLTNAHNEWLTVLVNTGILGVIGYVGMMAGGIRSFLGERKKNAYVCACGFCLLAYTVNNFFSFQQAMSTPTIFALFGMGRAFQRNLAGEAERPGKRKMK